MQRKKNLPNFSKEPIFCGWGRLHIFAEVICEQLTAITYLNRGWPVMAWHPNCTPPEVTLTARLGQLHRNPMVTHPSTNLATPCKTSVISQILVFPTCGKGSESADTRLQTLDSRLQTPGCIPQTLFIL